MYVFLTSAFWDTVKCTCATSKILVDPIAYAATDFATAEAQIPDWSECRAQPLGLGMLH